MHETLKWESFHCRYIRGEVPMPVDSTKPQSARALCGFMQNTTMKHSPIRAQTASTPAAFLGVELPRCGELPAASQTPAQKSCKSHSLTHASNSVPNAHEKAAWYLVYTKPRQEQTALVNLERQGYSCYLPRLHMEKIRSQRATVVVEAMFPRYLFVRLGSDGGSKSWAPVRSTLGVERLICFGARPARVDDALVGLLRQREQAQPTQTLFQPGERVCIASGPFAGIEAVFHTGNAQQRVLILLEVLGKTVPMHIEAAQLRKPD